MVVPENKEIEARGKILALSIKIEDSLNRIIFNFFHPKSDDKDTKSIFLRCFVMPLTFAQKVNIYEELLKTDRYKEKVISKIEKLKSESSKSSITDFEKFKMVIKKNLQEIMKTRNHIAHGIDISNAFIILEKDEVVLMNKLKLIKTSNEFLEKFSAVVKETYTLLYYTGGNNKD